MFDSRNFDNNDNGDAINWSNQWAYPIQFLWESEFARNEFQCNLFRVRKASLGQPSKNLYQEELNSNINKIADEKKRQAYQNACVNLPEGRSYIVKKAIDNRANQMSGGVDTYEYQVYDPWNIISPDTEALLSAQCKQDYILNGMERLSEVFSRDLTMAGITAVLVKYCPETDKNQIVRINPKNIWFDTRYSSTGEERFRGYSTMISWAKLKKMVQDDGDEVNLTIKAPTTSIITNGEIDLQAKYSNRKIRSLNGLDIYVEGINKLASSSQLQALNGNSVYDEYDHDMRSCYNLNWYRSLATDARAKTNNGYTGDDVELTVLYDLVNHLEFKIINRRYVISANSKAFRRQIVMPITDPRTGDVIPRIEDFTLECPLKFVWAEQEERDMFPYPTSTLMRTLDVHDELCALRAKRDHVSKILSILRIETNASDAESLRGLLNIMGIVLDDMQGDINTINFQYDYAPLDSEIQYREELIKSLLNSYDQFDALQAMGDRASAAESGMALSAVAQGLATHQNAIMEMFASIARQCIANRVAYSSKQEFPVINHGHYSALTIQEMALTATIDVKPKFAKKVLEKLASANALTLLGTMGQNIGADLRTALIEQAMLGTLPRKMIEDSLIEQQASEQEIALAQQEAQNMAAQIAQNQMAYNQNPTQYEVDNVMEQYSPEQIDSLINTMSADQDFAPTEAEPANESAPGVTEMAGYYNNPEALV